LNIAEHKSLHFVAAVNGEPGTRFAQSLLLGWGDVRKAKAMPEFSRILNDSFNADAPQRQLKIESDLSPGFSSSGMIAEIPTSLISITIPDKVALPDLFSSRNESRAWRR
jgi:hypothetical protein